jgi:hypothetical protein
LPAVALAKAGYLPRLEQPPAFELLLDELAPHI